MASASMIDMSLDEIIKINKKAQKATPRKGKAALKARALNSKRSSLAKPNLLKTMKAQALFKRARQTAAIAARVASDAAALVTPANAGFRMNRALAGTRRNRPVNRHLVLRERLHAVNRQIRQRRGVRGNGNVRNRLGVRAGRQQQQQAPQQALRTQARPLNAARNAVGVNNARFGARNVIRGVRQNNRGVVRQQNSLRGGAAGRMNAGGLARNRRVSQTNRDLATSPRYAQYIQQARALIRAQHEAARFPKQNNNSNRGNDFSNGGRRGFYQNFSMFVDVPNRNGGGGGGFGGFSGNRSGGRRFRR